jgi:hypothetical protein
MDMGFSTWNVRNLYKTDVVLTVLKELSDLMGVQEVGWDRGGTEPAG